VSNRKNGTSAITVPATSRLRYLGGMAALNLPSPTGTGDWHMVQTFFGPRKKLSRSFISGAGCQTDTTSILGDAGVYDCSEVLDELGIPYEGDVAYAASHARACADLVLAAVLRVAAIKKVCKCAHSSFPAPTCLADHIRI